MMVIVAIFDKKAAEYQAPMVFDSLTACVRAFARLSTENPKANIVLFAEDFDLYEVGAWDAVSGLLMPVAPPHFLEHISVLIQQRMK